MSLSTKLTLLFLTRWCWGRNSANPSPQGPSFMGLPPALVTGRTVESWGGTRDLIYSICLLFLAAASQPYMSPSSHSWFQFIPLCQLSEPATACSCLRYQCQSATPPLLCLRSWLCSFFSRPPSSNNPDLFLGPPTTPHPKGVAAFLQILSLFVLNHHFLPYQSFNLLNQLTVLKSLC